MMIWRYYIEDWRVT